MATAKKTASVESKALALMRQNRSVEDRAEKYVVSIARNIKRDVIDKITEEIEKVDDQIFELENFTLDTDVNKGLHQMTRDEAEKRFKEIINLEYKRKLLILELSTKQQTYDKYFGGPEL